MKKNPITKSYLLEELYYLVADNDTTDNIEERCRKIDDLAQGIIAKDEEASGILIQMSSEHELRGFALGFKVAMELK